jgi:hypothetical protein
LSKYTGYLFRTHTSYIDMIYLKQVITRMYTTILDNNKQKYKTVTDIKKFFDRLLIKLASMTTQMTACVSHLYHFFSSFSVLFLQKIYIYIYTYYTTSYHSLGKFIFWRPFFFFCLCFFPLFLCCLLFQRLGKQLEVQEISDMKIEYVKIR